LRHLQLPHARRRQRRKSARVEPLSPERYKVQLTASAELKAKIERATNLMRHANPTGDLAVVFERALDLLIGQLEKRRLGKTKGCGTKASRGSTRPGYVTAAVRREVFERDGEQCAFVDEAGQRCTARAFLELDHGIPRACGGADDAANVSVLCRRHNAFAAECAFGRETIERKKAERKTDPRQRGPRDQDDKALRALSGMGFSRQEANRAIEVVCGRWAGAVPPLETMLREAIGILT